MRTLDEWEAQSLAAYIADYIMEEQSRGITTVDSYMVRDAIDAFYNGAGELE